MKFTHILKAWLAYILYWHSGNMFPLFLYLSFFLPPYLSLFHSPFIPPSSVFVLHFEVEALLFSVIFICRTRARHIAAIIYSKWERTHCLRRLNFSFPSVSFYIFAAQPRLLFMLFTVGQWGEDAPKTEVRGQVFFSTALFSVISIIRLVLSLLSLSSSLHRLICSLICSLPLMFR